MNRIKQALLDHMEQLTIIDAHEHLASEAETLADGGIDLMGALLTQYIPTAFNSAGMTKSRAWLQDRSIPLSERWAAYSPYVPAVRHTGYFRTALLSLKTLYGIDRLDDTTYELANERIRQDLKPGYYDTFLKGYCKIERILNQRPWGHDEGYDDFAPDINREAMALQYEMVDGFDPFEELWDKYGGGDMSLDEMAERWVGSYVGLYHGIKLSGHLPFPRPSQAEAGAQLRAYCKDKSKTPRDLICLYLLHKIIELCGEHDLVVALHCGLIWECGRDFYKSSIQNVYQAVMTYSGTRFDVYHAGIPFVREAGVMGNQYPNANLNLTWAHEIAPAMVQSFLDEWIDLVPLNKIIGFGADGRTPFLTVGVRKRTFDNIAEVLTRRIDRGSMDLDEAKEICQLWLYDNPKRIYKL